MKVIKRVIKRVIKLAVGNFIKIFIFGNFFGVGDNDIKGGN